MRNVFLIGGKLVGLVVAYWTLSTLAQIGWLVQVYRDPEAGAHVYSSWYITSFVLYALLSGLFACLLLFKTEMLADVLRIPPDDEAPIIRSPDTALKIGLILIGVYMVAANAPDLVRELVEFLSYRRRVNYDNLAPIVGIVLKILLGGFLALRSDRVIEWLRKFEKREAPGQPEGEPDQAV